MKGKPAIPFPAGVIVNGAEQGIEAMVGPSIVIEKVQLCPPKEKAKLAVPLEVGVPDIVKVKFPAPFDNVPACNVAVNPLTPVEEIG